MTRAEAPVGVRALTLVWGGQLLSVVGTSLTGFVLAVWVFQQTGSTTQLALVTAANTVPGILLAPIAGVLADRWDRRLLMLAADCVAGAATVIVTLLYATDSLQVWHLYLTTALAACATSVHSAAYFTLLPKLVPERHLGRINGLFQLNFAIATVGPLLGGLLLATIGVTGTLIVDLATFAVATVGLIAVRLPASITRPAGNRGPLTIGKDLKQAWQFLRTRRGLVYLVAFSAVFDLTFAVAEVLIRPLILSFASAQTLGVLMFVGGAGLLAGTAVMTAWGGPRRRVRGILLIAVFAGIVLALHGAAPSVLLIGVVAPLFLFTLPIFNGTIMTIFQTTVPSDQLGRVTGLARTLWQAATLVGVLLAGPLADLVFEPALRDGGALADTVGTVIGTGPGRGIGLLYLVTGVLLLLAIGVAARIRPLRRLDDQADATATAAADDAAGTAAANDSAATVDGTGADTADRAPMSPGTLSRTTSED